MSRRTLQYILDRLDALQAGGTFPIVFDNGTYTFSISITGNEMRIRVHLDADGVTTTNDLTVDFDRNQDMNWDMENDFNCSPQNDFNVLAGNNANVGGSNSTGIALSGADLGFFGASPVPRQTASTLPQVVSALQAYGLLT